MSSWPVHDAEARFNEFLDACVKEGPQVVTRQGTETAVLIPIEIWHRLQATARPSLKQLLLAGTVRIEALVPELGKPRRQQELKPSQNIG